MSNASLAWLTGLATVGVVAGVWGSVNPLPNVHDEWAYVLQCEIFASGRWTAPAPPIPEFFEQFWVFVEPVVASKYWPGHSLLMSPGCMVGMPSLVPLLLSGLTGALLFLLVTSQTSRGLGLLAWWLWVTAEPNLHFRAAYFANVTSGAAWLVALWAVACSQDTRRFAPVAGMFAALGWAAITRPVTALALGWPLVVIVAWRFRHNRRPLILAASIGLTILLLIPLWSWMTVGSLTTTPYTEYARTYFPFDGPGFGFDDSPPLRSMPNEMQRYGKRLAGYFKEHTLDRILSIVAERLGALGQQLFGGWRLGLLPLAVFGAIDSLRRRRPLVVPLLGAASLFVVHFGFAHPPEWTHYYFESLPVLFAVIAIGSRTLVHLDIPSPLLHGLAMVVILLGTVDVVNSYGSARAWRYRVERPYELFAALPRPAVVFVREEATWVSPYGLVHNSPDLYNEPLWIVRDRGVDNQRLLNVARGRSAYLFELDRFVLREW